MKKKLFILVLTFIACVANSQQRIIDSIKQQMPTTNDTLMLVWSSLLAKAYNQVNKDSVQAYNSQYQAYCAKLNLALQEADAIRETANGGCKKFS